MGRKIYRFSAEQCDWKDPDQTMAKKVLGGKGAALVMMAQAGIPVPPGFTIPTDICNEFRLIKETQTDEVVEKWIDKLMEEVEQNMALLSKPLGYTPLVSVRSGAPVSMPGMMDTILNVGLTDDNCAEWSDRIGWRAALDSQRRLIQMLGSTAYGVPHEVFEFQLAKIKKEAGVEQDADIEPEYLEALIENYQTAFKQNKGFDFPINDAKAQLRAAIRAVFDSWMNPRAIEYRKLNNIPEDMGTAVNVQAMVFGNMGDDSGTGVLFTRCPSTGKDEIMGEFLQNAQGEDVVAGIRTPRPLNEMESLGGAWVDVANEILMICEKLEDLYKDMVDVEFTVQQGKLYILQSRVGKRSARAAFRIAVDLVNEGVIDVDTALSRLTRQQYKALRRPMLDPKFNTPPTIVGLPACPGVVTGIPVFSSDDAVNCKEPCILVTHETTPDDIAGMNAAVGILTQTGGATSHAAVVARAMDKPCVVGATNLDLDALKKLKPGTKITIDGSTGNVWIDVDVPVVDASESPEVQTVISWCMEKIGAFESSPVDLGANHRPHAVQAAYWWGSEEAMKGVIEGLAQMESRESVILDLRSPSQFIDLSEDGELLNCFGNHQDDDFGKKLTQELLTKQAKLTGLRLHSQMLSVDAIALTHAFGVEAGPLICRGDYAAFSVLSN